MAIVRSSKTAIPEMMKGASPSPKVTGTTSKLFTTRKKTQI